MKSMFVTAAPVGAVPKKLYPLDSNFISSDEMRVLDGKYETASIVDILKSDGWIHVGSGGMQLIHREANGVYPVISSNILSELPSGMARRIVLALTTQGWRSSEVGDLVWPHDGGVSYLHPEAVAGISINEGAYDFFISNRWEVTGAGLWRHGQACSPNLPVTASEIIHETLCCFEAGASVVHLHTRKITNLINFQYNGGASTVCVQDQANYIDMEQYDIIIPAIFKARDDSVLNISTSVRGAAAGVLGSIRRAPFKAYGNRCRIPLIASFSPGKVSFSSGGGYDNPDGFLAAQLVFFASLGVRPEIEVFNLTILDRSLGSYREAIGLCGTPPLFMLVACVDQTKLENGFIRDDSLVPPEVRKKALDLLSKGDAPSRVDAVACVVQALAPIVDAIRKVYVTALISVLLPGLLQALIVEVALRLGLDGIRVGLEDSLTIQDPSVPGGIRKATGSAEQVRGVVKQLAMAGISVMSPREFSNKLHADLYDHPAA